MARLEYRNVKYTDSRQIADLMGRNGITYERWGVRSEQPVPAEQVLEQYAPEINRLKAQKGYVTADLIALEPTTPNLEAIGKKFDKEHHHSDDEVRFTVEGEGVFEIVTEAGDNLKFTAEPGDLIVVPAFTRHLFYLTAMKRIRCIRLFKDQAGWEAIYEKRA